MQETKTPTRAELLELCKQRGLKATAWKKERMAAELEKLAAPGEPPGQAEAPEPEAGDGAGQFERETTADENPEAPPRLSGWCQGAAMWSRQHPLCRSKACGCRCHEDGWERPPVPEGARLSKFSTDHDKKETP